MEIETFERFVVVVERLGTLMWYGRFELRIFYAFIEFAHFLFVLYLHLVDFFFMCLVFSMHSYLHCAFLFSCFYF